MFNNNNVYICEEQNKIISKQIEIVPGHERIIYKHYCKISYHMLSSTWCCNEKIICNVCLNNGVIRYYKIKFVNGVKQIVCFDCIKNLYMDYYNRRGADVFFSRDDFRTATGFFNPEISTHDLLQSLPNQSPNQLPSLQACFKRAKCQICSTLAIIYYFYYDIFEPTRSISPQICINCYLKISNFEIQKTINTIVGSKNTILIKKRTFVPTKWSPLNHQLYPQPRLDQISNIINYFFIMLKKLRNNYGIRIDKYIVFDIFRRAF